MKNPLLYLTQFPDVSHHPLEDRIVERLRARDALPAGLADEIEAQHVTLAHQGLALLNDLEGAVRQDTMSPEGAEANIRLYAERLRHNMAVEELALFPVALRELDDDDWSLVEHMIPTGESDPLFDALVQTRFAELRHAIALEADCGCET